MDKLEQIVMERIVIQEIYEENDEQSVAPISTRLISFERIKRPSIKESNYIADFYLDNNGQGFIWPKGGRLKSGQYTSVTWVPTSRRFSRILMAKAFPIWVPEHIGEQEDAVRDTDH